ncbi:hypothetical protein SDC9_191149 [bioreactor metagenome]|uniref:Succinylglutamate desuccinylase n=1 Tax=bioreactor metagenome TaxID=1076179 RepID=A0A645HZG8_9ZZZZ
MAYHAIHNTLAHLGLTAAARPAAVTDTEALRLYQVVDRGHADDRFVRDWASFDRVHAGEVIGTRCGEAPVVADRDGYIVFPNPDARPGQEWFYLAKPSARV